jgi:hypothetical protein
MSATLGRALIIADAPNADGAGAVERDRAMSSLRIDRVHVRNTTRVDTRRDAHMTS